MAQDSPEATERVIVAPVSSTLRHAKVEPSLRDKALTLFTRLQTTLELESILKLFSAEVRDAVEHDHLSFNHDEKNLRVELGKAANHRHIYQLRVERESLGSITITRGHPFTPDELDQIEFLLGCLTYTLRNGMRYLSVCQAALRDPLTGINNRAVLDQTLRREISLARRNGMPLSLLMIDMDDFKSINDGYGHRAGDRVLKEIAGALVRGIRESDFVCRYGGEEFSVLLNNSTQAGAETLTERLRAMIENLVIGIGGGKTISATASFGIASLIPDDDAGSLLDRADKALYQAKEQGGNRYQTAD